MTSTYVGHSTVADDFEGNFNESSMKSMSALFFHDLK